MKAIITGGCGFIGSHILELVSTEYEEVIVIDNLATGKTENLGFLAADANVQIFEFDIRNFELIEPLFKNIDHVFHLAAIAEIVPSIEAPDEYFDVNANGTLNVLRACQLHGVAKIIYAASSSCYGICDSTPTSEQADINCLYPYAFTKYIGEQLLMHWAKVYELPAVSLRLFNVFGPKGRTSGAYGAVFGTFIAQKLAGRPFTVVGDGRQSRDFTYVTDIAAAFVTAARTPEVTGIFNIGTGKPQTILKLVALLDGEIEYIPKRPGEPEVTCADSSKFREMTGWAPKVEFEQGVELMLRDLSYWEEAPVWSSEAIAVETASWFKYLGS